MRSELTLRIAPADKALERQLKEVIKRDHKILECISQKIANESYLYIQMEKKNGNT